MRRKIIFWAGLVCGVLLACVGTSLGLTAAGGHLEIKLPLKHTSEYLPPDLSSFPPALSAQGSRLIDPDGKSVRLRGLMPPDAAILARKGKFNARTFEEIRKLGANAVRLPVFPEDWASDPDYLWRYLDQAATWAGENDLYLILDWHYIGNMANGTGPKMPQLSTPTNELTLAFWRQTAGYFRKAPHVIFEIFNEPQNIGPDEWRENASQVVQVIRQQGANQLVIVGGIDYGKDLSWVLERPVAGSNIAYASHIYPAHPQTEWNYDFGKTAKTYPVVITEWGYLSQAPDPETSYLVGSQASYGEPLMDALDQTQSGWVACWYDDEWLPAMFKRGGQDKNEYGQFVLRMLQESGK